MAQVLKTKRSHIPDVAKPLGDHSPETVLFPTLPTRKLNCYARYEVEVVSSQPNLWIKIVSVGNMDVVILL